MTASHINRSNSVAIIPARGGSERIPLKNMSDFGGKPALHRVISIAKESDIFEKIIVSTDNSIIADYAISIGVDIIRRPDKLSDNLTPIQPVIAHALSKMPDFEFACMILPTAVLLHPKRLQSAKALLSRYQELDFAIGIRRYDSPPQRALFLDNQGNVKMEQPEMFHKRSQDLRKLYFDAGQFSFGTRTAWLSGKPSFLLRTRGIELSRIESIDIDEPEDLEFAQRLFDTIK